MVHVCQQCLGKHPMNSGGDGKPGCPNLPKADSARSKAKAKGKSGQAGGKGKGKGKGKKGKGKSWKW